MNHLWDQTINISADLVATLLQSQFNLKVNELSLLGEGFDNIAFLINNSLVFRFPRRELGILCLENEIALLPYLAKKVHFPFSHPTFIGKPSTLYPFPFAGYTFLPGQMLSDTPAALVDDLEFAQHLGQWLQELHSIAVINEHKLLIKGDQSWRLNIEQRTDVLLQNIEKYKEIYLQYHFDTEKLAQIMHFFKTRGFINDRQCYLHADLYPKHILVNKQKKLSALIDWGDTHIGHPGIDLSVAIMIFSDEALEHFFAHYRNVDQNTKTIAIFRAFCHAMMALPYFVLMKEDNTVDWVVLALEAAMKRTEELR